MVAGEARCRTQRGSARGGGGHQLDPAGTRPPSTAAEECRLNPCKLPPKTASKLDRNYEAPGRDGAAGAHVRPWWLFRADEARKRWL